MKFREGISNRTIALDFIALRNVLKLAIKREYLRSLPIVDKDNLKWTTTKREFVALAVIEKLCDAALHVSKNGAQFGEHIRLMAYCGSRRDETFWLKWTDVKWQQEQIEIGSDGLSKNGKSRFVDFNPQLEAHPKEMFGHRAPDSQWIFPSPQRGDRDVRTMTFRETLDLDIFPLVQDCVW